MNLNLISYIYNTNSTRMPPIKIIFIMEEPPVSQNLTQIFGSCRPQTSHKAWDPAPRIGRYKICNWRVEMISNNP